MSTLCAICQPAAEPRSRFRLRYMPRDCASFAETLRGGPHRHNCRALRPNDHIFSRRAGAAGAWSDQLSAVVILADAVARARLGSDLANSLGLRCLSTLSWFRRNLVVLRREISAETSVATAMLAEISERRFRWYSQRPGIRSTAFFEPLPAPPAGYATPTTAQINA